MKKVIIQSDLLKVALKKLAQAINKNATLPILENLYMKVYQNEVQLITSDTELTIIHTLDCESKDTFEVLIPFEFLKKVAALAGSEPMLIEASATKAKITLDHHIYELNSLDKVKEYINLPDIPKENFISMNGTFISWLNRAQATCSKDDARPALTKICLDIKAGALVMATTDSTMLFSHVFPVETKIKDQLLISPKIAKALDGFASTDIYWHKNHIAFKSGSIEIIATRPEEKFPDYTVVFPESEPNLVLDRNVLVSALERACLNTSGTKQTDIFLKREAGTIHMETEDLDLQRRILVDMPGSFEGELETISVNADKLLTMMEQVEYGSVQLHIIDEKKAIVITTEADPDYKSLIMPLAVNKK